jgi:hypothetical protein
MAQNPEKPLTLQQRATVAVLASVLCIPLLSGPGQRESRRACDLSHAIACGKPEGLRGLASLTPASKIQTKEFDLDSPAPAPAPETTPAPEPKAPKEPKTAVEPEKKAPKEKALPSDKIESAKVERELTSSIRSLDDAMNKKPQICPETEPKALKTGETRAKVEKPSPAEKKVVAAPAPAERASHKTQTKVTSYFPEVHGEGGPCDSRGNPAYTLEDFIEGKLTQKFVDMYNSRCTRDRHGKRVRADISVNTKLPT